MRLCVIADPYRAQREHFLGSHTVLWTGPGGANRMQVQPGVHGTESGNSLASRRLRHCAVGKT